MFMTLTSQPNNLHYLLYQESDAEFESCTSGATELHKKEWSLFIPLFSQEALSSTVSVQYLDARRKIWNSSLHVKKYFKPSRKLFSTVYVGDNRADY